MKRLNIMRAVLLGSAGAWEAMDKANARAWLAARKLERDETLVVHCGRDGFVASGTEPLHLLELRE